MDIPSLGFGTWNLGGEVCYKAVSSALEIGYRHIDTADRYENHREVGKAINNFGIKRNDFFLTTKTFYDELTHDKVLANGQRFLEELKIDYIDLLLIHWPNKAVPIEETLGAMQELKDKGITKHIGVSNFTIHHLEDALKTGVDLYNNQVELHPSFNQKELVDFCDSNNIKVTAYSPLGMGEELHNESVLELSKKYSVSPAQVILNWIMGRGIAAIPKSTNPENIRANFNSLNWKMEDEDIALMNQIPQKPRLLSPDWNEFDY